MEGDRPVKRLYIVLSVVGALLIGVSAHADLQGYVNKPDDSYAFTVQGSQPVDNCTAHVVELTSQTWRGIAWKHWLTIYQPAQVKNDIAMLLVSGGNNRDTGPRFNNGEARIMRQIANTTNSVVAVLEQVPNQPLFDGLTEDGIISLTFEKYLQGGEDDWPLLLPMVKSAVRAMDTIQRVAREQLKIDINRFMVLGGSKRGWTTWLSAVVDTRIAGIAPVVIDMLNMVPQTELQLKSYGTFSEEIRDYTERGIQKQADTPRGQQLRAIVDPFAYCEKLTLPKLIVLGTNDPYWNVDSANLYFPYLKGEKHLYYCANTGHDVNGGGVATILAFYKSLMNGQPLPTIDWNHRPDGALEVTWKVPGAKAKLWKATSPNRDFRQSAWTAEDLAGDGSVNVKLDPPAEGWLAYYVEVVHPVESGMPFGLCTTMTVIPDEFPHADAVETFRQASLDSSPR